MPAIFETDRVTTSTPRVALPAMEYLPGPVRESAESYMALHNRHREAVQLVDRAQQAIRDAEAADEIALAAALVDGTREPKPRARAERAEAALADAKARRAAFERAVQLAHQRLREVVVEHAPEWLASVDANMADAVARLEQAAADWSRAHRDAVNGGAIISMLHGSPESLTLGNYRPAVQLSIAAAPLTEALAAVKADQAANAPAPADTDVVAEDAEPELVV